MRRGVWQLKRLTLTYCEHGGSSKGMREVVGSQALTAFRQNNPQLAVHVQRRNGKHPILSAVYVSGNERNLRVRNESAEAILQACTTLRNLRGDKVKLLTFRDKHKTTRPPLQGPWDSDVRILSEEEYQAVVDGRDV